MPSAKNASSFSGLRFANGRHGDAFSTGPCVLNPTRRADRAIRKRPRGNKQGCDGCEADPLGRHGWAAAAMTAAAACSLRSPASRRASLQPSDSVRLDLSAKIFPRRFAAPEERWARAASSGCGSFSKTAAITSVGVSPSNGGRPASIS